MSGAELYPAIDLRGGRVVRLRQGSYSDETVYGDDPVEVASGFADSGARWIHVVDLDAARSGEAHNRHLVAAVAAAVRGRARVQTGGGVRDVDAARALADAGVARVVMGSAAVADPSLVERVAQVIPVAAGLDHRAGEVAVHGWTQGSGRTLASMLPLFDAAEALIITDISRDGMMQGPDVDGLRWASEHSAVPVIASGGVATLADIAALAEIDGLAGVITGKALYEGAFSVAQAVEALSRCQGRDSR